MKKLILSAAILLGSITTFATNIPDFSKPLITVIQEEYSEIKTEELPESVKDSIKISYPDAAVDKAFVNDKKEYKIEISVGDQKATVYADADGNWIKK